MNYKKLLINFKLVVRSCVGILVGLSILIFLLSIILSSLYGNIVPEYFGDPLESIYSVFRLFSIEGWYDIPNAIAEHSSYVVGWRKVSDMSFIEELSVEGTVQGNQAPQPAVKFSAVTSEVREKEAISNKKLTINFPVNGNTLDNDARALIDREFVPIAKQFNNARVRIEGNTDNTGNRAYNEALSSRRAQGISRFNL